MASTKYKLFQGTDTKQVETDVNKWLASLPQNTSVSRSDTSIAAFGTQPGKADVGLILVSVWYNEHTK